MGRGKLCRYAIEQLMAINISLKKKTDAHDDVLFPESGHHDHGSLVTEYEEGQLAVDVFETEDEIVLRSAIAGVTQDDLDVYLQNDMLTVRGMRQPDSEEEARYLVCECHWGPFSRSIILPSDIDPDKINAVLKDGVLRVSLQKVERSKRINVKEIR